MTVLFELTAQGNEGLDIAAATNDLDDYVELNRVFALFGIFRCLWFLRLGLWTLLAGN